MELSTPNAGVAMSKVFFFKMKGKGAKNRGKVFCSASDIKQLFLVSHMDVGQSKMVDLQCG